METTMESTKEESVEDDLLPEFGEHFRAVMPPIEGVLLTQAREDRHVVLHAFTSKNPGEARFGISVTDSSLPADDRHQPVCISLTEAGFRALAQNLNTCLEEMK